MPLIVLAQFYHSAGGLRAFLCHLLSCKGSVQLHKFFYLLNSSRIFLRFKDCHSSERETSWQTYLFFHCHKSHSSTHRHSCDDHPPNQTQNVRSSCLITKATSFLGNLQRSAQRETSSLPPHKNGHSLRDYHRFNGDSRNR